MRSRARLLIWILTPSVNFQAQDEEVKVSENEIVVEVRLLSKPAGADLTVGGTRRSSHRRRRARREELPWRKLKRCP